MERYGLDDDRAFAVLARYSQHTNTKLRTVALRLIETRTLPGLTAPDAQDIRKAQEPAATVTE